MTGRGIVNVPRDAVRGKRRDLGGHLGIVATRAGFGHPRGRVFLDQVLQEGDDSLISR